MNEVKIFENEEFGKVRTLIEGEDKVLFCGTDVAQALGYSNPWNEVGWASADY